MLEQPGASLEFCEVPTSEPDTGHVLLHARACGVFRTDLHIVDGELEEPKLPLVLGHEIVGEVVRVGAEVEVFSEGDRVGVPWLGWTCGTCRYCRRGQEKLCANARFTGYTRDGRIEGAAVLVP